MWFQCMWWSGRPGSRAGLARAMMPSSGAGFPFWDKAHLTYKIFSSKSTHFWRRLGGLGEYARSYSACCKSSSSSSEQLGQVAKWAGALLLGTVRAKFLIIIKKCNFLLAENSDFCKKIDIQWNVLSLWAKLDFWHCNIKILKNMSWV